MPTETPKRPVDTFANEDQHPEGLEFADLSSIFKVDIPKFNTFYKAYKESLNPNLSKFANKNFNKYVFDLSALNN